MDYMTRPVTPGWTALRGHPFAVSVQTSVGTYLIEYVHTEWKAPPDHGTLSYRYIHAITFPQDGRRVEWVSLSSGTYGELIQMAIWHEENGLATVTRPAQPGLPAEEEPRRKLARPARRFGGGR